MYAILISLEPLQALGKSYNISSLHLIIFKGNYTVTLIEGDGIGPEISQSVKDIFAAAKASAYPRLLRQTLAKRT